MAYLYNLPNNTTNLDQVLVQTVSAVPGLTPLLMAFVFFVVLLGGSGLEKLRRGTADYAMWSVVASMSMLMVTIMMTVISGIVRLEWFVTAIVITIFCGIWLFLSKRFGEV